MMESGNDEIDSSRGVHVKVSTKNCIKDIGNKIKSSVEDNNCNLTLCPDDLICDRDFGCSSKHVSYNGPNGIVNGVDLEKYDVQLRTGDVCKQSSKCNSSPCEKCCSKGDSKLQVVDGSSQVQYQSDCCKQVLDDLIVDSTSKCSDSEHDEPSGSKCTALSEEGAYQRLEGETSPEQTASPLQLSSPPQDSDILYVSYENEHQMPDIMRLIQKDLSEPYSIYTYRYFIHKWPQLCFLAMDKDKCVGAIVCKLDIHRKVIRRGYIAMLAVDEKYRKRKIGTNLVLKAIRAMVADNADEIVLETEITNNSALWLYENLGFVRDKRLFRYYLNGVDALRLKLWLR